MKLEKGRFAMFCRVGLVAITLLALAAGCEAFVGSPVWVKDGGVSGTNPLGVGSCHISGGQKTIQETFTLKETMYINIRPVDAQKDCWITANHSGISYTKPKPTRTPEPTVNVWWPADAPTPIPTYTPRP